jgi:predicted aspartyl protease
LKFLSNKFPLESWLRGRFANDFTGEYLGMPEPWLTCQTLQVKNDSIEKADTTPANDEGALMRSKGNHKVGRFSVEFEVANNKDLGAVDLGLLEPDKIRRFKIRGVVDSGATRLVLPEKVVAQLGLTTRSRVKVKYANNEKATRDLVMDVYVKILGRPGVFTAVVEPKRESALIGAIVLEDLDFVVDCTGQKLVPRDPRFVVSELE